MFFSVILFGQSAKSDSCKIKPLYKAYFKGLKNSDSISIDYLINVGKMVCSNKEFQITSFIYNIEEDLIEDRYVKSAMFSDADISLLKKRVDHKSLIAFNCILAKNKNGQVISCESFVLYIK